MEKVIKRREDGIEWPKKKKNTRPVPDTGANVDDAKAKPIPSEEEVEEFFAILRRMHVAVRYFENGHTDRAKATWRAALETEMLAMDGGEEASDGGERKAKKRSREEIGLSLDLNAAPEEAHAD